MKTQIQSDKFRQGVNTDKALRYLAGQDCLKPDKATLPEYNPDRRPFSEKYPDTVKPQPDKATAIASLIDAMEMSATVTRKDIAAAKSEHAALEAVAEAAQKHGMNCNCSPKERLSGHRSECFVPELEQSLAALAQVRKEGGK